MLSLAYDYAIENSTDPSTQNGAIIECQTGVLVYGANHFPKGIEETKERYNRPMKYNYVEHAERNSIYSAAKLGHSTEGATMYCPWFACAECSRAIIQSGIITVIGHNTPIHNEANSKWQESITIAINMLLESGINLHYISEPMNKTIRFNEELVTI